MFNRRTSPGESRIEVSFCVVNTEQRELLLRGLDAIAAERERLPFATEVIVLDNASQDGSAASALSHPTVDEVIALDHRQGKSDNDTTVLKKARGRFCLMLNEDSELLEGATATLRQSLIDHPQAGAAGAALLRPNMVQQPSAWRFPTPVSALASALFLHRYFVVQSRGEKVREVDWAQSAALMVRSSAAEAVDYLDSQFFVYSDEVDFCKRLHDGGWKVLYVPEAKAIHHEQLSTGSVPHRRIVELSRNRDRYMVKHHGRTAAFVVRMLTAWTYALRSLAAFVLPNHDPARYGKHVEAALSPNRGEGLREAAAEFNRGTRL